jgi:hypothetical protein
MVLQIGRDLELLRLRASIIASAGYAVQSMTPDQVPAEFQKTRGRGSGYFATRWISMSWLFLRPLSAISTGRTSFLSPLNDIQQAPGLFDELVEPTMGVDKLLRLVATLAHCPSVQ